MLTRLINTKSLRPYPNTKRPANHSTSPCAPPASTNNEGNADANDDSLRKWKESLGLGTGENLSDPKDPRKVIIFSLGLEVEGRSDIVIDLTKPGALEDLNKHPFTIKEGATFRMKARFRVQHEVLSGLKYVQVVSRMGVKNKMQEMIVCRSPLFSCLFVCLPGVGLVCADCVRCRARTRRIRRISRSMRRSVSSPTLLARQG